MKSVFAVVGNRSALSLIDSHDAETLIDLCRLHGRFLYSGSMLAFSQKNRAAPIA